MFKVNDKDTRTTAETLEQGIIYVQSYQQRHQNNANGIVLVSLLITLNIFHNFSSVSIVNFEPVSTSWEDSARYPIDLNKGNVKVKIIIKEKILK